MHSKCQVCLVQICHVCGTESRLGFVHTDCREKSYLDGLLFVVSYDWICKNLIRDGKYGYYYEIFNDLGKIMGDYAKSYKVFDNAIILPVPLHSFKYKKRGFNQSALLAKNIALRRSCEMYQILKRVKHTKSQVSQDKAGREINLKSAFKVVDYKNLDYTRNVIIVDDVFTTGSTLSECAKTLKAAGFKHVYGFTFAKRNSS